MIKRLLTIPPVVIDGFLWVALAIFGAVQIEFSSDEAYKYINAFLLFWIKSAAGILVAGCMALKNFRSTSYAKHIQGKEDAKKEISSVVESTVMEKQVVKQAQPVNTQQPVNIDTHI